MSFELHRDGGEVDAQETEYAEPVVYVMPRQGGKERVCAEERLRQRREMRGAMR